MSKKPVVLMILDGYGLNERHEANAVYEGKTPVMDGLMKDGPFVKGNASGLSVGLPDGQMGNSEVGHLNMGAGRIVYQELTRITKSIQDGDFFENKAFMAAVENCKKNDSALHLFGLVSDGGVHSHITHIYGLLELAKRNGLKKVYVHCFLDGRDTPPTSGKEYVAELEEKMAERECFLRFIHLLTDTSICGLKLQERIREEGQENYTLVTMLINMIREGMERGELRTDLPIGYLCYAVSSQIVCFMASVSFPEIGQITAAELKPCILSQMRESYGR